MFPTSFFPVLLFQAYHNGNKHPVVVHFQIVAYFKITMSTRWDHPSMLPRGSQEMMYTIMTREEIEELLNTQHASDLNDALHDEDIAKMKIVLNAGIHPHDLCLAESCLARTDYILAPRYDIAIPCGFEHAKHLKSDSFREVLRLLVDEGLDVTKPLWKEYGHDKSFLDLALLWSVLHLEELCTLHNSVQYIMTLALKNAYPKTKDLCKLTLAHFIENYIDVLRECTNTKIPAYTFRKLHIFEYIVSFIVMNKHFSDWSCRGFRGMTPLHLLACMDLEPPLFLNLFTLIDITKENNINCKDIFGYTPLHLACETHKAQNVEALLQRGANIDETDIYGWKPICVLHSGSSLKDITPSTFQIRLSHPNNFRFDDTKEIIELLTTNKDVVEDEL